MAKMESWAGKGHVIWPAASAGAVSISAAQMTYMLEGIDLRKSATELAIAKRWLAKKSAVAAIWGSHIAPDL
ncbi:hypothetical protein ACVW1C_005977 [Bradyrhizobium sp. USDA 4011]